MSTQTCSCCFKEFRGNSYDVCRVCRDEIEMDEYQYDKPLTSSEMEAVEAYYAATYWMEKDRV